MGHVLSLSDGITDSGRRNVDHFCIKKGNLI